jgi:hypothetical protein
LDHVKAQREERDNQRRAAAFLAACDRIIETSGERPMSLAIPHCDHRIVYLRKGERDRAMVQFNDAVRLGPEVAANADLIRSRPASPGRAQRVLAKVRSSGADIFRSYGTPIEVIYCFDAGCCMST